MFTRGSRFFFAAAALGFVAAFLYGFLTAASDAGGVWAVFSDGGVVDAVVGPITLGWKGSVGEHVGYSVLLAFAGVMLALGGFTTAYRDADAEAVAEVHGVAVADLPPAAAPWGISYWPLLAAFSAGVVVVGLAFNTLLLYAGLVGLLVAAFEWTARAWSERATGDPALNAQYRNRLLRPLEVPVGVVIVIVAVALAVSRVLLAVSELGAVFVIILLAAVVFGLANLLSARPELRRPVVLAVLVVGGLVIIGGGIAAGVAGPREIEEHSGGEAMAPPSDSPVPSVGVDTDAPVAPAGA